MITYEFFVEKQYLLVKFSGDIDRIQIMDLIEFVARQTVNSSIKKALLDFRDAKFNWNVYDLDEIVKFRLQFVPFFKKFEAVHLVHAAIETAFSILFSEKISGNHSKIDVCSAIDRSIELLKIDMTNQNLEDKLNNLANKFVC